jgi:hypothetical protein
MDEVPLQELEGPCSFGSGGQPVQNSLTIGAEFDVLGNASTRKSRVSQDPSSTPSHAAGETVHTPGVHHSAGGEDRSCPNVADEERKRPIHQNLAGAGRPKRDRRGCGGLGRFLVHGNESLVEYGADEKRSISSIPEKSA